MALSFNGSTSKLQFATPFVSAPPATLMAWIKPDATYSGEINCFGLSNSAATTQLFRIHFNRAAAADQVAFQFRANDNLDRTAIGATNLVADTWNHVCGTVEIVAGPTANLEVFLNGDSDGTASGESSGIITLDHVDVGVLGRTTDAQFWDGEIAECAAWSVVLSDAEIAVLAMGVSPLFVRPQSLAFYAPLIRDVREITTANVVSANTDTTVFSHPPMRYPFMQQSLVPAAEAPVSTPSRGGFGGLGSSFGRLGM